MYPMPQKTKLFKVRFIIQTFKQWNSCPSVCTLACMPMVAQQNSKADPIKAISLAKENFQLIVEGKLSQDSPYGNNSVVVLDCLHFQRKQEYWSVCN